MQAHVEFELPDVITTQTTGDKMHRLIEELYPICRSITGAGVHQTLSLLKNLIPLVIYKIPTGTKAFDWEVPKEWNIRDAYIKNSDGETVVDFANSNLHVLNYSTPIHEHLSLQELKSHLHTLPEHPDWIPYRTSYYKEEWGFCLSHNQYRQLEDDIYEVCIDSSLTDGHLTFGECYIQGELSDEVLISTHICHPSLCNDNLSGVSVATFLASALLKRKLRYSYRFLFIPGTIGAVTWLSINESKTKNIRHGLTLALLGNDCDFIYKKTRKGDFEIDQVVETALLDSGKGYQIMDFIPYGYDERQFCSPGFNLPVGSLTRSLHDQFPEYHSSADNLDLIKPEALEESLKMFDTIVEMLETNKKYFNVNGKCEPNLGKRGLYNTIGGDHSSSDFQMALLWVLNLSDGSHSLLDICRRAKLKFELVRNAANALVQSRLLVKV